MHPSMSMLRACKGAKNGAKLLVIAAKSNFEGPCRGLNPGPPAPKAGIIPLDHTDDLVTEIAFFRSLLVRVQSNSTFIK